MGKIEELRNSESYTIICAYAEETLLATLLFSRATREDLEIVFDKLAPECFWSDEYKILYKGARECFNAGQGVAMASVLRVVRESLKDNTLKPDVVTRLSMAMPVQADLIRVADSIIENANIRKIVNTLDVATDELLSASSTSAYLADLIKKLEQLKNDC